ncbi:MAG: ABC transporter substrate-binding protein [Deltaproteobacteria bacterium]|jgi:putative ABC transport system substrate-binding protein|nr:ABC transporter substrate-binding protein [Deltaproteobacteria bacterium]
MLPFKTFFLFLAGVALAFSADALAYTVSINQLVEHPSLDEAVRGFKEQLAALGVEVTYNDHNAQGNQAAITQIVNQIIDEKPDLVLAVATPSAQQTAQKIRDIPILFTAVTDPVSAGLVASMEAPGGNVTGTTDMNPIDAQLALIQEVLPQAKNIGIIYNAGEINSTVQVDLAKAAGAKLGFAFVDGVTANTAGVLQAAQSLVGKVDAIYLPTDNTVISSLESVLKVAIDHKIPVFPSEDDSVRKGGLATVSLSYYELGRQTGRMAAKILQEGATPASMPVESQETHKLIINAGFAKLIGFTIPPEVQARAAETLLN